VKHRDDGDTEVTEMANKPRRTLMGTEVQVLFSDVQEAHKFAETAIKLKAVVRVGLVRPVVRRRPQGGVVVEVDDYNKPT
jgi:hypothetical protein